MRSRQISAIAVSVLAFALAATAIAQQNEDKSKRPSPPGTASISLGGKKVTVEYGRPSARGRKVMGGLVPWGEVWRTGANEATTFVTEGDVTIGDTKVPAGKYTLYTLPSETGWKLIINKQTGQWGTQYDQTRDLARIDMKVSKPSAPVEQLTIDLKGNGTNAADLIIAWENTSASVTVKAQ
jgi:hypothetical protein